MDHLEYEKHAIKACEFSERKPLVYKVRVFLFALLGYLVVFGLLFGFAFSIFVLVKNLANSATLSIFLITSNFFIAVIFLIWILLRPLWKSGITPQGYELTREKYPLLFKELDFLCQKLNGLKIHQVLLSNEFNAAIIQTSRLGIVGIQKNTLVLGLEVMLALTPDQVRSVIAHELGHLSGYKIRFSGWVYGLRHLWFNIVEGLTDEDSPGSNFLNKFFSWYAPMFSAYSFPLARFHEYQADATGARLTSIEDTSSALINTDVLAPYTGEHYWAPFLQGADHRPDPEHPAWSGLYQFLRAAVDAQLDERLREAFTVETSFEDTHPCLKDRLSALGVEGKFTGSARLSGAEVLFGEHFETILSDFDNDWNDRNLDEWHARNEYVVSSRQELDDFGRSSISDLSDEEIWRWAMLCEEFDLADRALEIFRVYQDRNPDDDDCAFIIGRLLYELGDEACLQQFERTADNMDLAYQSCLYAVQFLTGSDQGELIKLWTERGDAALCIQAEAEEERQVLSVDDSLVVPDHTDERLISLIDRLLASPSVSKAWIARKITEYGVDTPAYAVAVSGKNFALSESSLQKKLIDEIAGINDDAYEFDAWVIPRVGDFKPLAEQIVEHGHQVVPLKNSGAGFIETPKKTMLSEVKRLYVAIGCFILFIISTPLFGFFESDLVVAFYLLLLVFQIIAFVLLSKDAVLALKYSQRGTRISRGFAGFLGGGITLVIGLIAIGLGVFLIPFSIYGLVVLGSDKFELIYVVLGFGLGFVFLRFGYSNLIALVDKNADVDN